ncbi:hypothetical protein PGT21_018468 [Puccinia graminis f. sp. tritici]|uniref:Uncharacterized protein n=1 Tax=Puccinia graminis f. sp. tritici TaxID=56615 RepID=A0A5B0QAT7_PUCGR|nr:hypothetical protein PGT21_018468 [Puccinia graminis f. sp. tritici]
MGVGPGPFIWSSGVSGRNPLHPNPGCENDSNKRLTTTPSSVSRHRKHLFFRAATLVFKTQISSSAMNL